MKLTFLVGLPGSGKTWLGQRMAVEDALFVDDLSKLGGLDYLSDFLSTIPDQDVVIADIFLCESPYREKVQTIIASYGLEVEWIFFENNLVKCMHNLAFRWKQGDKREVRAITRKLSKTYTIPEDVTVRSIVLA